ncbi:MAG: SOS response-associated peptidase [Rhizobiaceae bacterium]|nr:SOS response-associated peptidase [Rhizobiaceae bacterium]
MCGRFTLEYSWAEIHDAIDLIPTSAAGRNDPPRFNIAPTQQVGFLSQRDDEISVQDGRWWLVPFWAKEIPKYPLFNAHSETAHEKSSFRESFKSKRCLIPASGYFEWTKAADGGKDPHLIHLPDKQPFLFAGLWAHNSNLDITSCTILTAAAHPAIEHLHHRMPIVLGQSSWSDWLSADTSVASARQLLEFNRGGELVSYPVGREVNSSRASGASLVEPLAI